MKSGHEQLCVVVGFGPVVGVENILPVHDQPRTVIHLAGEGDLTGSRHIENTFHAPNVIFTDAAGVSLRGGAGIDGIAGQKILRIRQTVDVAARLMPIIEAELTGGDDIRSKRSRVEMPANIDVATIVHHDGVCGIEGSRIAIAISQHAQRRVAQITGGQLDDDARLIAARNGRLAENRVADGAFVITTDIKHIAVITNTLKTQGGRTGERGIGHTAGFIPGQRINAENRAAADDIQVGQAHRQTLGSDAAEVEFNERRRDIGAKSQLRAAPVILAKNCAVDIRAISQHISDPRRRRAEG